MSFILNQSIEEVLNYSKCGRTICNRVLHLSERLHQFGCFKA